MSASAGSAGGGSGGSGSSWNQPSAAQYRPLNVRDALSYLDQVKIQFVDQPDVYNRFLDVMKEFKGQVIDTPGVIDRVSTLFRGHPSLIQGFNTFLPPGYRIECIGGDGENQGMITVTTPTGTVSQVPGRFSAAISAHDAEAERQAAAAAASASAASSSVAAGEGAQANGRGPSPGRYGAPAASTAARATGSTVGVTPAMQYPPAQSHLSSGPPPFQSGQSRTPATTAAQAAAAPASTAAGARTATGAAAQPSSLGPLPIPSNPTAPSGPSTPSAAQFLASGGLGGSQAASTAAATAQGGTGARPAILEFNHAITFVNKIKTRFTSEPDTYKQFLEILQTYQRDTRDIGEVYDQVTKLFQNAPDLIDEFKQFLPEHGGVGGMAALFPASVPPVERATGQKRAAKDAKDVAPPKKRRGAQADGAKGARKKASKADSPSGEDGETSVAALPGTAPQTLASPDEVAFFDKVKKFIDDKYTYHEFLKLINLFTQDMLDTKGLVERAEQFIGQSGEIWTTFKKMVLADDAGNVPPNPTSAQGGYGFGGMINVDQQMVENTPMLERVKPDLGGSKVKSYGPSYRKLPKTEINLQCTGRDAMCWEVLNDEWVSHPTWAAEDAAPFMTHKKNVYEEALHKSEEERHEYDYHIEANLRTIALLEPLNNKIQVMDPEERAHFNLKAGLGGQSKSIYQRIIKKVYGKDLGPDIIRAIHENPVVALPIVVERLKAKDDEWKKAQREWNRVWREQDAKNFYKALDHQGVQFKQNDKKTLAAKSLIAEVEARRREQTNTRAALVDPSAYRIKPQFEFEFKDIEVVKDVLKLVISYLDRVNNALSPSDKERIERQLRDFVPLLLMLDQEEFDAEFGDAEHGSDEQDGSEDSDGDISMADDDETSSVATGKRGKKAPSDLRKRLLKQAGDKEAREQRGSTMTPGPEEAAAATEAPTADGRSHEGTPATENGDRAETPLPVPDDPAAVAEAVEKDRADADASEQTWVQIDVPEGSEQASEVPEPKPKLTRKANFFANNHFYVLIRLIQLLYSRLLHCKNIAAKLAAEKKQPINPMAIKLGLADPETQFYGIEKGENPAQHYYGHLLSIAEKLFENEVDVGTYEETLRLMFSTKAYTMFTLDRVVAAIVKQTQTVLGDMKSQELFALLQRDRQHERTTTRQQIAYRYQAEGVLGAEENLYKVQYHAGPESITVQLMGKEDLTVDDAETAEQRWRNYVDSYVLTCPTEGLPHRVDSPFLKRTLADLPTTTQPETFDQHSGLGFKFALRSFKMFYIPDSEDYFVRNRTPAEIVEEDLKETEASEAAKKRLDQWINKKAQPETPAETASAEVPPVAA